MRLSAFNDTLKDFPPKSSLSDPYKHMLSNYKTEGHPVITSNLIDVSRSGLSWKIKTEKRESPNGKMTAPILMLHTIKRMAKELKPASSATVGEVHLKDCLSIFMKLWNMVLLPTTGRGVNHSSHRFEINSLTCFLSSFDL